MKTILISGGGRGFGRVLAEQFSKKYNVVILVRDPEKAAQAAKEIGCDFVVADVKNYEQVERAVDLIISRYTSVDYLINNAGFWISGLLEENNPSQIEEVIDTSLTGTIFLTRAVLPYMKKARKGRVINVISQAGLYGRAERSVHHASKWAVTGFTKSLQVELAGSGVTVSGFYPGSMKTRQFIDTTLKKNPSRFMEFSDAARAVEFIVETPGDMNIPELGIKPAYY